MHWSCFAALYDDVDPPGHAFRLETVSQRRVSLVEHCSSFSKLTVTPASVPSCTHAKSRLQYVFRSVTQRS